ncbi:hypothetical protein [Micromonospora sp. NPDC002717]|uniref:hypothetical protein n=1 Tax=Micromonospora sp. NPDC002717 TaxID=3154424 RepID=UPI0033317483
MMTELGGRQPRERIPGQLQRDLETVSEGSAWIKMVIPDDSVQVAGTVTLYVHDGISEIGWMVLPEFGAEAWRVKPFVSYLALPERTAVGD